MTRPLGEMNEPDPPLLKRTDDFCTCSSHSGVASKPYFFLSNSFGRWLNSHIPSSAPAGRVSSMAAAGTNKIKHSINLMVVVAPFRYRFGPVPRGGEAGSAYGM